jgi:hypothetical protein
MGYFSSIAKAIYNEYDRRIKRASLITEYGAGHGHSAHDDHAEAAHAEAEHAQEDEGVEIVNVPRGTPVEQAKHE